MSSRLHPFYLGLSYDGFLLSFRGASLETKLCGAERCWVFHQLPGRYTRDNWVQPGLGHGLTLEAPTFRGLVRAFRKIRQGRK